MLDEVQVGMGRSGQFWGDTRTQVLSQIFSPCQRPGGGIPIGAVMRKSSAMSSSREITRQHKRQSFSAAALECP